MSLPKQTILLLCLQLPKVYFNIKVYSLNCKGGFAFHFNTDFKMLALLLYTPLNALCLPGLLTFSVLAPVTCGQKTELRNGLNHC